MWIVILCIVIIVIFLFVSTVGMKSITSIKSLSEFKDSDIWVKVKVRVNDIVKACWCRVIPDEGVEYYDLYGDVIDQCRERISVVEACLESNVSNPIPKQEITQISNGFVSEAIPRHQFPFKDKA